LFIIAYIKQNRSNSINLDRLQHFRGNCAFHLHHRRISGSILLLLRVHQFVSYFVIAYFVRS